MKKRVIAVIGFVLFLSGCGSTHQQYVVKPMYNPRNYQLSYELNNRAAENNELYFIDSKYKKFYSGVIADGSFESKIVILLKKLLPKKKMNLALMVNSNQKDKIRDIVTRYISEHSIYELSNVLDEKMAEIVENVKNQEKDGLYESSGDDEIELRQASDAILYIDEDSGVIKGSLLKKNYDIISQKRVIYPSSTWVSVKVPRNDGEFDTYEVMVRPVKKQNDISRNNISYDDAANYCFSHWHARMMAPYVFEAARKDLLLEKPKGGPYLEFIEPIDDEYDEDEFDEIKEQYLKRRDKLKVKDDKVILFNWKNEKYMAGDRSASYDITFRCMKEKK
jgi:hypothetical protein